MTTNVSLPPALEEFARDCVSEGRFSSVSEVVREALRLLQAREERRKQLGQMLQDVQDRADREGTHSLESVLAEMDEIIDKAEAKQAGIKKVSKRRA